jgi:hypothetical protein
MSSHFNGGFVQETGSRTRDSAVIVGFNDGFDPIDYMFAPTSYEVRSVGMTHSMGMISKSS